MSIIKTLELLMFPERVAARQKKQDEIRNIYENKGDSYLRLFTRCITEPSDIRKDIKFLTGVVNGTIRREKILRGLCNTLVFTMSRQEFLRGYRYWGGQLGYVIRLPHMKYDAKTQYENELNGVYSNEQIAYYRARQELAQHWLTIMTKVYEDYLEYKNA